MISPPRSSRAFSLVEVALSIGIIAFAFVALLSLLPAGLTTFRRALDTSICTQISQRIVSEAQLTDFDVVTDRKELPPSGNGQEYSFRMRRPGTDDVLIRYFDEQGNEVVPSIPGKLSVEETARVIYAVNVRIIPRVNLPTGTTGFPIARAKAEPGNLAQITVQIARNPSGIELPLNDGDPADPKKPERNLWKPKGGIDIFTYSAYLGKNQ